MVHSILNVYVFIFIVCNTYQILNFPEDKANVHAQGKRPQARMERITRNGF